MTLPTNIILEPIETNSGIQFLPLSLQLRNIEIANSYLKKTDDLKYVELVVPGYNNKTIRIIQEGKEDFKKVDDKYILIEDEFFPLKIYNQGEFKTWTTGTLKGPIRELIDDSVINSPTKIILEWNNSGLILETYHGKNEYDSNIILFDKDLQNNIEFIHKQIVSNMLTLSHDYFRTIPLHYAQIDPLVPKKFTIYDELPTYIINSNDMNVIKRPYCITIESLCKPECKLVIVV